MSLENKLEEEEKPAGIGRIVWDCFRYSPFLAGSALLFGPVVTLSTLIPTAGYAIGAWYENKKNGIKTTWKQMRKELYSGNIMGHFDYALFSTPELLFNNFPKVFNKTTFSGKLLTTLAINPLIVLPYNMVYHTFTYLRDNFGWRKTFSGMFNGKIFNYLGEVYSQKIKKDIWTDTKNVFKYMFPLHFFMVNYLTNPTTRIIQSVLVNNPIYRYVMGKKKTNVNNFELQSNNIENYNQPRLAYA